MNGLSDSGALAKEDFMCPHPGYAIIPTVSTLMNAFHITSAEPLSTVQE